MGLGHAAVYGTLRQAVHAPAAPALDKLVRWIGPCTLRGRLVDHGAFPGFFPAPGGAVVAELVEIRDPGFFAAIDAWELYREDDPEGSLFLRRRILLAVPKLEAWVYVSNGSPHDPPVTHGDWARHLAERG